MSGFNDQAGSDRSLGQQIKVSVLTLSKQILWRAERYLACRALCLFLHPPPLGRSKNGTFFGSKC